METAFGDIQKMLDDYEKMSDSMSKPMPDDEMEKTLEKMGRLQEAIEAVDGWNLKHQVDVAMDALFMLNYVAAISYPDINIAGIKDHMLWGTMLAITFFHGPGKISVDYLLKRKWLP